MKHVLAALGAIAATPVVAEELPIHLKDGATWTITAEHAQAGEGLGPSHNWSLTTTKRLTWHRGAKGAPATLTVTPLSATAGPGSPAEVAQARSLGIPATLYVDEGLIPGPVLNREEARAEVAKLITSTKAPDPVMLDSAAKAMIASELIVASYAEGLGFGPDGTISAEVEMPNPLGGPAMRGKQTAVLDSIDAKAGRALVHWHQSLNPDSIQATAAAMAARMAKDKVQPEKIEAFKMAMASAKMSSESDCRHQVDVPSGLAVKVECTATSSVTMQGHTQVTTERWLITQTLPDKS
jgi:hypothetical protein